MPVAERIIPFNVAQLRNLRNWSPEELPLRTMAACVSTSPAIAPSFAIAAVHSLIRAHTALRCRLTTSADGRLTQEALTPEAAMAALPVELVNGEVDPAAARIPPEEGAMRCTLYLCDGRVHSLKLSVSHVFIDALGVQALVRDLKRELAGDPAPSSPHRQIYDFADTPDDPRVRANTEYWKSLLISAPRSCTYSGVARDKFEKVSITKAPLAVDEAEQIERACRELHVSAYIIWAAAVSSLVSLAADQHRQVFRSTYANRYTVQDLGSVAQLAQAVYIPVSGTERDTFRDRVTCIAKATRPTYERGVYDANALLDWLNRPDVARGAVFQPAFELNFVPLPARERSLGKWEREAPTTWETEVRVDPPSAKADLAISVAHEPHPVLRLSARRPVSRERGTDTLAADLVDVIRVLCENPDRVITDLRIAPFSSAGDLLVGHSSGVAVDVDMTCALVRSCHGVESCEVEGGAPLVAKISVRWPVDLADLVEELRAKQPWFAGSVVPDEFVVYQAT